MAARPVLVAVITTQPLVRAGLTALAAANGDRVILLSDVEANLHPDRIELFVYDATIEPVANADALGELMGNRVVVVALAAGRPVGGVPTARPRVAILRLALTETEMIDAIHLAVRGPRVSAAKARQHLLADIAALTHLTRRQVAILECIGSGWSNAEIASDQSIGIHTVKRETKRILGGIDALSRVQAVRWASDHGLAARPHAAPALARGSARP